MMPLTKNGDAMNPKLTINIVFWIIVFAYVFFSLAFVLSVITIRLFKEDPQPGLAIFPAFGALASFSVGCGILYLLLSDITQIVRNRRQNAKQGEAP